MSIDIDRKTEQDLTELAALKNVSVNALLREFAQQEKQYLEERAGDAEALKTMQAGRSISHADMKTHIQGLRKIALEKG